ncbi:acetyltransferase [Streptomyces lydicus]|uniref:acetyltransferase n=1 Tax=Streptomyces lydicus TaxID=47763 RepID=UPI00378DE3BD
MDLKRYTHVDAQNVRSFPQWRRTGRAKQIHDTLLDSVEANIVTLLVDATHHKVQALYERWEYVKVGEAKPSGDSPLYAVMAREMTRV